MRQVFVPLGTAVWSFETSEFLARWLLRSLVSQSLDFGMTGLRAVGF
jgi:hypothetical protein